ncbi:MAG: hypothetical protein IJX08_02525 [Clostridia bacterium]|nr:hypothetical protein [Clostridia bacterium]
MTKRLTALLLILLLALSAAAGCTPKTTTEQPDNATPSPTPSVEQSVPSSSAGDEIVQEEVKIPFGLYRITSTDGKVLSYGIKTNKINYTATDYQERCWTVESFRAADGTLGYTLYAGDLPKSALTLERLLPGGTSKIQPASAVNPDSKQKFMVEEAGDGTFILRSFTNPKFALSSGTDSPTLVAYEEGGENIKWKFEALTEGCDRYVEWRSEGGIFTVRMGPDILQRAKISSERMQEWANDMEKTYYSYIELTGFIPYQHIIFKAYESEEYPGYVMGDYMVISADMVFMYDDIAKMALREKKCNVRDYNFLMLHELGHMFDMGMQWKFEGEAMTDIKIGYVLYDNPEAVAAPSGYNYQNYFNSESLIECYNDCAGHKKMNGKYDIFRTAAIFNEFGVMDNWESMKKTYHWFVESGFKAKDATEMLEKYVEKLSEYSGKDIRSMINDKEWETLVARTKGDE